ncbi:MAG: threonine/serine dehydratase [Gammaproteobacteria bacterium]|nr:threonine/serine dehydratase [Gammaproteobacteria bacterium]
MHAPTIEEIEAARTLLGDAVVTTPVVRWPRDDRFAGGTEAFVKLELFQVTGTFKARGALMNVKALDAAALRRGITAVSAGNHAIAAAYAARVAGTTAKVVMIHSANPVRVQRCRELGAELVMADDAHAAFELAHDIEREEGRALIHPFEGRNTVLGTATVGLELARQVENLDAVIVPVGGGGLCAGVALAHKLLHPSCAVFGVEPAGADSMSRSFKAGEPQTIERVDTIADSLGAPYAAPYSFEICRANVDGLVTVSDDELKASMRLIFDDLKLAVEPACAASTAALRGPLAERLAGKRVALIACGSNIDRDSYFALTSCRG